MGWLCAVLAAWGLACTAPVEEPPLEVLFAGCGRVLEPADDPVCVLRNDARLRLFIRAEAAERIEVEGASVLRREGAGPGWLLTLDAVAPPRLSVSLTQKGRRRPGATWHLEVKPPDVSPPTEALLDRFWQNPQDKQLLGETERLLRAAEGLERADLMTLQGRLVAAFSDYAEGLRIVDEALEAFRQAGSLSDLIALMTATAGTAEELEQLPAPPRGHYESAYRVAFKRGRIASHAYDERSAIFHRQEAVDLSTWFGDAIRRVESEQALAYKLAELGLIEEAGRKLEGLLGITEELHACEQAVVRHNLAWARLLAWEGWRFSSARPEAEDVEGVVSLLREVEQVYRAGDCWQADSVNLHLDLALAYLLAGRFDHTRDELERARKWLPSQVSAGLLLELTWFLEIEARVQAAEGRPHRALEKYDELARLAQGFSRPTWRAQVGRAHILRQLGGEGALEAYRTAESTLDAMLLSRPIEGGRHLPVEPGTRAFVDFLLDRGRTRQAFEVARHAYARPLRALSVDRSAAAFSTRLRRYEEIREEAAREALESAGLSVEGRRQNEAKWEEIQRRLTDIQNELFELSVGEDLLRQPGTETTPGEVLLLYHPLPSGWAGFALEADGTLTWERLGPLSADIPPQALGAKLLKPFAKALAGARRLRILPYGELWAVDFHALPWADGPLAAVAPVVYSLDLPAVVPQRSKRAFLYRSPTLAHARRDAAAARAALAGRGFDATSPDELSRSALLETLEALEGPLAWAHFSTHAEVGGPGGLRSLLELGAGSSLMASELLALRAAPEVVVLAACESGGSDLSPQSLSVAKAFLLAGSSVAVAAVRGLDDAAAAELMVAFYRFLGEAGARDAALPSVEWALRRAQLEVGGSDPERTTWADFRVIVR